MKIHTQPKYSTGTVTVTQGSTDVAGSTTPADTVWDTTNAFGIANVRAGGLMKFSGSDDTYRVQSVTDANNLVIQQVFGTGGSFTTGNTYEINELIQSYANTDNLYDLILDKEAESTTESNSFVKTLAANFDVVVNVRNGKNILPFTQNPTVNDAGGSATVVRQPDTIAV